MYNTCKVPQSSIEFQAQIQQQKPGGFSKESRRRAVIGRWATLTNQKRHISKHCQFNNDAVDHLLNHPDTSNIQSSF
jgi:hypothetical protein